MKKLILFSVFIAFAFVSCKKEVTQVVHEGAKGFFYSIPTDSWEANNDSTSLVATLPIPELTKDIVNHGAVMVYLSFTDGEYEPIPEVFDFLSYIPIHSEGQVKIEIRDIEGLKVPVPGIEIYAKIVILDAQAIEKKPNVNLDNFLDVKQAFDVKMRDR